MALPEPCIPGLVGCSGARRYELAELPSFRSRIDTPTASLLTDPLSGRATSSTLTGATLAGQASTNSPFASASSASSSSSSVASGMNAMYYLQIKNMGTSTLSDLIVTHGPRPLGVELLSTAPGCSIQDMSVQCAMKLLPGEMRTFHLTYSVGSKSCATIPTLQKALPYVGTQVASSVVTDVSCTMVAAQTPITAAVEPVPSETPQIPQNDVVSTIQSGEGYIYHTMPGYKPVQPRTGAADRLFAAVVENSTLTPIRVPPTSSEAVSMLTIALGFSIVLIGACISCSTKFFCRRG